MMIFSDQTKFSKKRKKVKKSRTNQKGAYSKVRSAFSSKLRQNCAIKCIDKRNAPDDFVKKFLPRELEILPRLNHKNIIKVFLELYLSRIISLLPMS